MVVLIFYLGLFFKLLVYFINILILIDLIVFLDGLRKNGYNLVIFISYVKNDFI